MREQVGDNVWVIFLSTFKYMLCTLPVRYFFSLLSAGDVMSTYQHTKYYDYIYTYCYISNKSGEIV